RSDSGDTGGDETQQASEGFESQPSPGEPGDAPQQADSGDTGGDETQQASEGFESQPSPGEPGDGGEQGEGTEPQLASNEPGEASNDGQAETDAEPDYAEAHEADAVVVPAATQYLTRWASDQGSAQCQR